MFLPSGTMCNELAIRVHCAPGDEVIADRTAHIVHFEGGAPAALSGVMIAPLDGERGVFTGEQARAAVRDPANRYAPRSRLLAVEQTANLGGGTVWPMNALRAVVEVAREHGLATHMDGARLLNAAVASGVPARRPHPRVRHGVDRSQQGSRLSGGRGARDLPGPARRRMALEAAPRRGDAPGRDPRRGRDPRPRPPRRSPRRGPCARPPVRRGGGRHPGARHRPRLGRVQHRLLRGRGGDRAFGEGDLRVPRRTGRLESAPLAPRLLRAVTHLDVGAAEVDAALEALREVLGDGPEAVA